jgi:hypothetical protein
MSKEPWFRSKVKSAIIENPRRRQLPSWKSKKASLEIIPQHLASANKETPHCKKSMSGNLYTVSQKRDPYTFAHNLAKYWPILKIFQHGIKN